MLHKFILPFILYLAVPLVNAGERDINKAEWICPTSVTEKGIEHTFKQILIYDGPPEEKRILKQESGDSQYQYQYSGLDKKNTYLVCQYDKLENDIIIRAVDATFCGMKKTNSQTIPWQGVCWEKPSDWPAADELDINKIKWVCPSDIKIKGLEHKLSILLLYDGPPEENKAVMPDNRFRKGAHHRELDGINTYLVCEYANTRNNSKTNLIIHAEKATFCGRKKMNSPPERREIDMWTDTWYAGCWDTPRPH